MKILTKILIFATALVGCNRQSGSSPAESQEAKQMLQGVWMDSEGGDVSFRVKGDTIFYSDTTSMPAYFRIIGDSLVWALAHPMALSNSLLMHSGSPIRMATS